VLASYADAKFATNPAVGNAAGDIAWSTRPAPVTASPPPIPVPRRKPPSPVG